ncbi:hypothetical protein CEXT_426881 [Caerostris extrusa]|uniref:Uncharacterized protein n=1 Tax=Caerostris extrusa TaxID=172846 RepID=A0AAV4QX74_CAEEX|nr:hypothetical protein CEXT_426881 [Caerostris extrusa]
MKSNLHFGSTRGAGLNLIESKKAVLSPEIPEKCCQPGALAEVACCRSLFVSAPVSSSRLGADSNDGVRSVDLSCQEHRRREVVVTGDWMELLLDFPHLLSDRMLAVYTSLLFFSSFKWLMAQSLSNFSFRLSV